MGHTGTKSEGSMETVFKNKMDFICKDMEDFNKFWQFKAQEGKKYKAMVPP